MTTNRRARPWLVAIGIVAVAGLAGYLATWAMYPAPILPDQILVPALRGTPASEAMQTLQRLGLRGRLADSVSDPLVGKGAVAWQSPVPETQLPEGSVVKLGVSAGSPIVAVPDVVDLDLSLALRVLGAAGFTAGTVDTARNDADAGTVLQTQPGPGSASRPGQTVTLTVSSGPRSVRVPALTGLDLDEARNRLEASGLRLGSIDQRPGGRAGQVIDQSPLPGDLVNRDSPVNLTLGGGN